MANVQEPRPFLPIFRHRICNSFIKGPMLADGPNISQLQLQLMSTRRLRTEAVVPGSRDWGTNKSPWYRQPVFDASEIILKYGDFTWTTTFPLERPCISETGPKAVIRNGKLLCTGYRNIASVCFPHFQKEEVSTEQAGDVYTGVNSHTDTQRPITPLIIPSTSPTPTITPSISPAPTPTPSTSFPRYIIA